ncbi:MAG TPA: 2-hydroxyacid dehydrogenase [Micromonosporaceae bacterium]|jgi:phosphoglycerate dehydrogenase-like enzyme|nr:2-hydroxyacid dehydrogenase [Micromonosporaceae bacterium]
MKVWVAHEAGVAVLHGLQATIEVYGGPPAEPPSDPATVEFWAPPFLARGDVVALVEKMPALRVVQLLTAGADAWVGRLRDGVLLCDARGVHSSYTSEWVAAVVLAYLREIPGFVLAQARREWAYAAYAPTDELAGKRVLVVGAGAIGTAVAARLAPFETVLTMVARRARPGVRGVDELDLLLPYADVVVLAVPLTPATRGLVDAAFLARLPDGALVVNAARGPVVDTAALAAELATGRLSAALDVVDPEPLPADHPLWTMPNLLLTPHVAGSVRSLMPKAYGLVRAQLVRYLAGEPLENVVVDGY